MTKTPGSFPVRRSRPCRRRPIASPLPAQRLIPGQAHHSKPLQASRRVKPARPWRRHRRSVQQPRDQQGRPQEVALTHQGLFDASHILTVHPARANTVAQARPIGPAPIMATVSVISQSSCRSEIVKIVKARIMVQRGLPVHAQHVFTKPHRHGLIMSKTEGRTTGRVFLC